MPYPQILVTAAQSSLAHSCQKNSGVSFNRIAFGDWYGRVRRRCESVAFNLASEAGVGFVHFVVIVEFDHHRFGGRLPASAARRHQKEPHAAADAYIEWRYPFRVDRAAGTDWKQ